MTSSFLVCRMSGETRYSDLWIEVAASLDDGEKVGEYSNHGRYSC